MKMQQLALALGLTLGAAAVHAAVDAGIPAYQKTSGISGNLSSVGSDTLANLMTFWADRASRFDAGYLQFWTHVARHEG